MQKKFNKDKISFLIAAHNCEDIIKKTVKNILDEVNKFNEINFELIIVDDLSLDSTWNKLHELTQISSNIKIYKNKKNLGFCGTIYSALELSTGNYIKLIHCADYEPNLKEFLKKYNKYDILLVDLIDTRSFFRKYLSIFCNTVFKLITSKSIKYFSSSLMCKKILFQKHFNSSKYGSFFLPLIISKLLIDGYNFNEIPVKTNQNNQAIKLKSKALSFRNLMSFFCVVKDIIKYRIKLNYLN